ncbi:MAG: hypothetical protein B6U72_02545 [Candidatus Altiarchaeales archaeon ex4484_2]|nr:MAG: hypothetical protein B6U72_02545 [Candidatus Altiarchaeales archaeon ex4484_2]
MKSATSILVISLFLIGFIVCISSIVNIFTHKTVISYPLQFISACLLIICGTLLIARAELIQIRGRIGDRRGFDELDARVSGLEGKKERISSWKFSDLEHRVDELEKKVRN